VSTKKTRVADTKVVKRLRRAIHASLKAQGFTVSKDRVSILQPRRTRRELEVAAGLRGADDHLLAADKSPRVQRNGAELTITVPSVLDHEVVAIDV
jgi:hypothetical protein